MTTATVTTVIDHTSDAGFRAWAAELITLFVTTLGLTQTADTGQINTTTVTRPATNTAGGYVILRFNDTAQSTSPIFMKIEFGTANSAATPAIWITVGTSSNGSGTITGVVTSRVACSNQSAPASTSTAYITRAVYNATLGVFWLAWKLGGAGTNGVTMGGFVVSRSSDNTGAVTTDSAMVITNASAVSGSTVNGPYMQVISYLMSAAFTTSPWPNATWFFWPFTVISTLFSGQVQVGPCFQYTPVVGILPWAAVALQSELALSSTAPLTIVGSTPHTYIAAGGFSGSSSVGIQGLQMSTAANGYLFLLLWE